MPDTTMKLQSESNFSILKFRVVAQELNALLVEREEKWNESENQRLNPKKEGDDKKDGDKKEGDEKKDEKKKEDEKKKDDKQNCKAFQNSYIIHSE